MTLVQIYMWAATIVSTPFLLVAFSYLYYRANKKPNWISRENDFSDYVAKVLGGLICFIMCCACIWFAGIVIPAVLPIAMFIGTYYLWDMCPPLDEVMKKFFGTKN